MRRPDDRFASACRPCAGANKLGNSSNRFQITYNSVLQSNVPFTNKQGNKPRDGYGMVFNRRFQVEAKEFAVCVSNFGIVG